jgi:hypothetical protein
MYILWYLHYILTFFGAIGTNKLIKNLGLFSSVMLHGRGWHLVTDVTEQSDSSVPSSVVKQSKKAA